MPDRSLFGPAANFYNPACPAEAGIPGTGDEMCISGTSCDGPQTFRKECVTMRIVKSLSTLLLSVCLLTPILPGSAEGGDDALSLLTLNVGKADCLLLRHGGLTYMVDTGTAESWGAVSAALRANGITRLDGVILTHTDKDHAGGLPALAASGVEVGAWYSSAYYCEVTEKKHPAILAAAQRGQSVRWLKAGDSLPFGDGTLRVIGPTVLFEDKENNNSVVLLAEAAGGRMLLCGDMEEPEEKLLLAAGAVPNCDVLKVGHHGEGDATCRKFALAVMPEAAVISTDSVAEPDTPDPKVLSVLRGVGAEIWLTEETKGGVLAEIRGGRLTCRKAEWTLPDPVGGVAISAKDNSADTVTLRNGGSAAADLSGWYIISQRGGEIFVLPEGTVLAAGASLTVGTETAGYGDLIWPDTNVWHNNKDDAAILYDACGREMDRAD